MKKKKNQPLIITLIDMSPLRIKKAKQKHSIDEHVAITDQKQVNRYSMTLIYELQMKIKKPKTSLIILMRSLLLRITNKNKTKKKHPSCYQLMNSKTISIAFIISLIDVTNEIPPPPQPTSPPPTPPPKKKTSTNNQQKHKLLYRSKCF